MKQIFIPICIICMIFSMSCSKKKSTKTTSKKEVLCTVNGNTFTMQELQLENPHQDMETEKIINDRIKEWIETELLYQKAKDLNIDQRPDVKWQIEQHERYILSSTLLEEEIRNKIELSEDDLREYYENHKDEFTRNHEERHALNLFIPTKKQADKVYQSLKSGTDFNSLMNVYDGGDLGYIRRDWEMSQDISDAVFNTAVGNFSKPIKTSFGYFIIKVTDIKKAGSVVDFEWVKEDLRNQIEREKYATALKEYLEDLKKDATIKKNKDLIEKIVK